MLVMLPWAKGLSPMLAYNLAFWILEAKGKKATSVISKDVDNVIQKNIIYIIKYFKYSH